MKKSVFILLLAFGILFANPHSVFAHVVVKPSQVSVAAFQTFTVGVPNEKDTATTGLRLVIPEGLLYVTPNVKPGWKINVVKSGAGESVRVTEISWTGGSVPVGQRDEFVFSAKVPSNQTTISWKAYQTYQDGTVVSWDKESNDSTEGQNQGPASKTAVVTDTTPENTTAPIPQAKERQENTALIFSLVALALSIVAVRKAHSSRAK